LFTIKNKSHKVIYTCKFGIFEVFVKIAKFGNFEDYRVLYTT